VRSSIELTDAGLHHLGRLRGGTLPAVQRASGSTRGSTADAERSGAALDAGLAALDISGCTALTDQSWLAIAEASDIDIESWYCGWLAGWLAGTAWRLLVLAYTACAARCVVAVF
jgi:hypothetical protein